MQPSSTSIEFTSAEREALELRLREDEALVLKMAASSREESQRLGEKFFHELAAPRRVQAARRVAATTPAKRPGQAVAKRRRRAVRTSTPSRGDPEDADPEPDPWALGFVDRAPLLWRVRALRCRLLEIREGVDR